MRLGNLASGRTKSESTPRRLTARRRREAIDGTTHLRGDNNRRTNEKTQEERRRRIERKGDKKHKWRRGTKGKHRFRIAHDHFTARPITGQTPQDENTLLSRTEARRGKEPHKTRVSAGLPPDEIGSCYLPLYWTCSTLMGAYPT